MRKNSLILLVLFLFLSSYADASSFYISDDETVYLIVNPDKGVEKTIVVDWIRVEGKGDYIVYDIGDSLENIEKVLGDGNVSVQGDRIEISGKVNGLTDIYYRGETSKLPPVSLKLRYFLNGKKISYQEAVGKKGTLRIEFNLENKKLNNIRINNSIEEVYTPFIAIINGSIPVSKVKDLKLSEGGMKMVIGSNMNFNLMLMPQPKVSGWLEVNMDKISLSPIQIVILPSSPTIPSLTETIDKFTGSISQLDQILDFQQKLLKQMAGEIKQARENNGIKDIDKVLDNIEYDRDNIKKDETIMDELSKYLSDTYGRNEEFISYLKEINNPKSLDMAKLLEKDQERLKTMILNVDSIKKDIKNVLQTLQNIDIDSIKGLIGNLERIEMSLNAIAEGGVVGFVMIPGLNMLREGIEGGKKEIDVTKEKMKILGDLAKGYNTFIGKPQGAKNSGIRFIYYIKFES